MPPTTQLDAPEVVVKELVRREWTAGNVDGITPYVVHGWLGDGDGGHENDYRVTVSNPEESAVAGGQTGYAGIDPSGAGPVQMVGGTLAVNVWASRGWTGTGGTGGNPRKVAYLMKREVERVLFDHHDGTDADDADTSLDYLSPESSRRFVEDADEPDESPLYRYQVTVAYGYHREP